MTPHTLQTNLAKPLRKETAFAAPLLAWFAVNRREMPWRGHPDPYAVWISEIMLQQTQVATVHSYFIRFLKTFPTIQSLATAETDVLLKAWEGLGYYTRARNLRKAAQIVVEQFGGKLPVTPEDLLTLPGIGHYSAAAIASICYGTPVPVVDGNVARVFARYRLLTDDFTKLPPRLALAEWLTPAICASGNPGDFNQAMMELGALICTPRNPNCTACPLARTCAAKKANTQADYPTRKQTKQIPERHFAVVILSNPQGHIYLVRREERGLLGGLYELPAVPADKDWKKTFAAQYSAIAKVKNLGTVKHQFSHFTLILDVYTAEAKQPLDYIDPSAVALATAHKKALALRG